MSTTALLVDTSYLLELLKVPDRFQPEFAERVKKRFSGAVNAGHRAGPEGARSGDQARAAARPTIHA